MGKNSHRRHEHEDRRLRFVQRHGQKVTSKRERFGKFVFSCNHCGATATFEANNYGQAWKLAKASGWIAGKVGVAWLHWCDWTHRVSYDNAIKQRESELRMGRQ